MSKVFKLATNPRKKYFHSPLPPTLRNQFNVKNTQLNITKEQH